jgi:hypothetical protein
MSVYNINIMISQRIHVRIVISHVVIAMDN